MAKFCGKCGCNVKEYEQKTVDAFCTECGAKCEKGALFCMECGAKILSSGTATKTDSFGGGFETWNTSDGFDGWGETLSKFNAVEETNRFVDFEYRKMPNGKIIIEKLIDEYALSVDIPDGVAVVVKGELL